MTEPYTVNPVSQPIRGTIRPPGSKSLTNRALIVSALAAGTSRLTGVLDSQDTRVMVESLGRLGLRVDCDVEASTMTVHGCGGTFPINSAELWLENSGTSIRFLTALCALAHGRFRLDGNGRMRERPIGDLTATLNQLGSDCRCERDNDCPPVVVVAQGLPGGKATVRSDLSSQFLSAMLMVAPYAMKPVEIQIEGELVSEPYVEMTLGVMQQFGMPVHRADANRFRFEPGVYNPVDYQIEPDASAASYFFAVAAMTGGQITVPGLSRVALQGDVKFVEALERMGCEVHWDVDAITVTGGMLHGIDIDMNEISDTAQTLAVVATSALGPTRIRNVAHMRHKETDRVSALVTELRRLGQEVEEFPDGLLIHPAVVTPAVVETYDDHRMAMSFSLLGLRHAGIQIANPRCVEKTYPNYFADLERLCGVS
ncbi:MAG: 3-phosphoshikimate 1-carboxyvinyltransferase [Planctomycetota bacterium]|nr:3-phosphoshikimate 1-carboxyvinyltransferase [Planctomycetota bacterium]MDA1212920.1 3-phosphoshikimate 1-carboxyvinyltransferase [Planctomycetota bacterium]